MGSGRERIRRGALAARGGGGRGPAGHRRDAGRHPRRGGGGVLRAGRAPLRARAGRVRPARARVGDDDRRWDRAAPRALLARGARRFLGGGRDRRGARVRGARRVDDEPARHVPARLPPAAGGGGDRPPRRHRRRPLPRAGRPHRRGEPGHPARAARRLGREVGRARPRRGDGAPARRDRRVAPHHRLRHRRRRNRARSIARRGARREAENGGGEASEGDRIHHL